VARVVAGALARDPDDRWQSATDLGLAARAAAGSVGAGSDSTTVPLLVRSVATETVSRRVVDGATDRRRKRIWAVAAVAAVLALMAVGIWATARGTIDRNAASPPSSTTGATSDAVARPLLPAAAGRAAGAVRACRAPPRARSSSAAPCSARPNRCAGTDW
jgi:hypothetical protein